MAVKTRSQGLTESLSQAIAKPAAHDDFAIHQHLDALLKPLSLSVNDIGGEVSFIGADPIIPSTLRIAGATSLALAVKSIAVAKIWRMRTGQGQDISMDLRVAPHRLCPFYDGKWELLNGYPLGHTASVSDAFGFTHFYRTADDRFVLPLNPYPGIRLATEKLLGVPEDVNAVAKAISTWKGTDLEDAAEEIGIVMPMVRTTQEFIETQQYRHHLANMPLVEIEKIGDSDPVPFAPNPSQPLSGIRVLGRGHIIAGGAVGRTMALHGAEVLNIWKPNEYEVPTMYFTSNVGVRSTTLDLHTSYGQGRVSALLPKADVFYANRRPGYLESMGLGAEQLAERKPGIIHASVTLNGRFGPWSKRVGFDQTAGSLAGVMSLEGDKEKPGLPPVPVVNDYITAWLLAAGVYEALIRRSIEGGSYRVHVSLTRIALWIVSLGIFDRDYAISTANSSEEHLYLDPKYFEADTPLGRYRGIEEQIEMSVTPGNYPFTFIPRGSAKPEWL